MQQPDLTFSALVTFILAALSTSATAQVRCKTWEPCFVAPNAQPPNATACHVWEPCFVAPTRAEVATSFDTTGKLIPGSRPRITQGPLGPMPEDSSGLSPDDHFALALKQMPDAGIAVQLNGFGYTMGVGLGVHSGWTSNLGFSTPNLSIQVQPTTNVGDVLKGGQISFGEGLVFSISDDGTPRVGFGFNILPQSISLTPIDVSYGTTFGN